MAAVTFWQVFDCDKLTLLKIGVGYIAPFWHGWMNAAKLLMTISQRGTVRLDRFRLRDRQRQESRLPSTHQTLS